MTFTDAQLALFLDQGYLHIPLAAPASVHDELFLAAKAAYDAAAGENGFEARLGHIADEGLINSCPALHTILDAPELDDALNAVLGPRYYRYNHAFVHRAAMVDQDYHKDSHLPWSMRGAVRSHRPQWVMTFYYPQDTTVELGATRVLPGTQYWNVDHEIEGFEQGEDRLGLKDPPVPKDESSEQADLRLAARPKELDVTCESVALEVPKGSLLLVNFDLFHRGARRFIARDRFMYKFWYCRTMEPRKRAPIPVTSTDPRRLPVVQAVANWLSNTEGQCATPEVQPNSEAARVALAYSRRDVKTLSTDLLDECEPVRRPAMYGATTLGETGVSPALAATRSSHWGVRKSGAFVLGELAVDSQAIRDALQRLMAPHERADVRSTAVVALGRIARTVLARAALVELDSFVDLLAPLSRPDREPDLRERPLPGNPVRQNVALALLSIATEAVQGDAPQGGAVQSGAVRARAAVAGLDRLRSVAEAMADSDTDRYARATAQEVVRRLGQPQD